MKFTETHEWVILENQEGTVGVTDYAQHELGDIVYVELPEVGSTVNAGDEVAVLESTKAAADLYSPLSGTITAVNEALNHAPEQINSNPEDSGWIFKVKLSDPAEYEALMDRDQYEATAK